MYLTPYVGSRPGTVLAVRARTEGGRLRSRGESEAVAVVNIRARLDMAPRIPYADTGAVPGKKNRLEVKQ